MTNIPFRLDKGCPLPNALNIIGERWTFLILRSAIFGLAHFEDIQSALGIARNILSNRLSKLVQYGILSRHVMTTDKRRVEYRLTDKGWALTPALMALRQWAEQWEQVETSPMILVDKRDLAPLLDIGLHDHNGQKLALNEVMWMDSTNKTVVAPLRTPLPKDKETQSR